MNATNLHSTPPRVAPRSTVVPMLLRAAQAEGLLRVSDVSAALLDAGLPSSAGTAHNAIQADSLAAEVAVALLERLDVETIAHAAARVASGTYTKPLRSGGNPLVAALQMHADLGVLLQAAADGQIDEGELDAVTRVLTQTRDTAAAQLAALDARRGGRR